MIREIVKYGHPALRTKGKPVTEVTDDIIQLAEDMIETMEAANGVGLAAQQVGVALQLAVVDITDVEDRPSTMLVDGKECDPVEHMPLVLLNPVLTLGKETEPGVEGCLSFPEITAQIVRPVNVTCRAHLLDGSEIEFDAGGLLARALQHEVDHLNGVLFIDRMNSATKAGLSGRLKRMQRENVV
jgi:peptide deformylase